MAKNNTAFIDAHPSLAARFRSEGFDWLNRYVDYKDGRINEEWVRDANGTLVDITAKSKAYEELELAQEELARINAQEARA